MVKQKKRLHKILTSKIKNSKPIQKAKESVKRIKEHFNIAVVLSLMRLILAPIIFISIVLEKFEVSIFLFIFAGVSDLLDGYFARHFNQVTVFGKNLDPLADKVLINLTFFGLVLILDFPLWILLLVLLRDISLLIVGIYKNYSICVTKLGKFYQASLVITVVWFLLDFPHVDYLYLLTSFLTIITGIDYLYHIILGKRIPITIERSQNITQFIRLPDYFTLGNAVSGLVSIFFSLNKYMALSALFLIISLFFDFIDGKIARKINREGSFGKEMDSLCDVISFGVAPAVFGLSIVNTPFALISVFLFLSCGILRLARYNVTKMEGYYYGMPITFNALFMSIIYFTDISISYYPYIFLGLGFLMIAPFKIKKVI